jgi:hypothetical protein
MKRTTGLLIAFLMYGYVNAAPAESVAPQEVGFGQDDELVLDEATLKEFENLEKDTPLKTMQLLIAALPMMKDAAVAHLREHKKAYIAGTATTLTLLATVIAWKMLHKKTGVPSDIPPSN